MVKRKPKKFPEGTHIKETADFIAWKKEFNKMSLEDHEAKLKELGLDDEDIKDFEKNYDKIHPKNKKFKKKKK